MKASTRRAAHTAHLEQIGKIAFEVDRDVERHRHVSVVDDRAPRAQQPVVNVNGAANMNRIFEKRDAFAGENIRVRQIGAQVEVVVP